MTTLLTLQGLLLPSILFCFFATITPGPNNILLTYSGSHFGYYKSLPFILGIRVGIVGLFITIGFVVSAVALTSPNLYMGLKFLSAIYLSYLALKIGFSKVSKNKNRSALVGFQKGALLQFINPKAIMTVLSCVAAFGVPGNLYFLSIIQICLIFNATGFVSNSCWALFGTFINRILSTPKSQKTFNWVLAILLFSTVVLIFFD